MTSHKTSATVSPDEQQVSLFGEDLPTKPRRARAASSARQGGKTTRMLQGSVAANHPPIATAQPSPAVVAKNQVSSTSVEGDWLVQGVALLHLRAQTAPEDWDLQLAQWAHAHGQPFSSIKRHLQSVYDYGSVRAILLESGLGDDIPSIEDLCAQHLAGEQLVGKCAALLDLGSLAGLAPAVELHRLMQAWLQNRLDSSDIQALRLAIAHTSKDEVAKMRRQQGYPAGVPSEAATSAADLVDSLLLKISEIPDFLGHKNRPTKVWRQVNLQTLSESISKKGLPRVAAPEHLVLLFQRAALHVQLMQITLVSKDSKHLRYPIEDLGADKMWVLIEKGFDENDLPDYCGILQVVREGTWLDFEVKRRAHDLRPYADKRNQLLTYCLLQALQA